MYLNSAIKHKTLDVAVNTILSQQDEDKCWSLYLACIANPLTEEVTFEDFLKKCTKKRPEPAKQDKQKKKQDPKKQVLAAERLLKSFIPPKKGGR